MQELKDYKLLDNWGMTKELAIKLTGLGTIAMFVFAWLFGSLYFWLTGNNPGIYIDTTDDALLSAVFPVTLLFSTLSIHELFHGLFIKKYGAKPVYGAGLAHHFFPYFYATTKEKFLFSRRQFIIIILAPLFCISTIGIILMLAFPSVSHWLLFPLISNAAGAVGDIWMTRTLLRYPKHIMIADDKNGMMVYGKNEDKSLNIAPSGFMRTFAKSALNFFFAVTALIIFLPILLAILKVSSFTIGPRDSIFTIFDYSATNSGGFFSLGYAAFLSSAMLSAFAGLIYTVLKADGKEKKE